MTPQPLQLVSKLTAFFLPVLLGASAVVAENNGIPPEGDGGKKHGRPPRHLDHQSAFNEADTNRDGFLTPEEFSQMKRLARLAPEKRERLFAFLDKNKDGKLHHRELHPLPPPKLGLVLKQFQRLDSDGNGALSMEELARSQVFNKTPAEHLDRMFRKHDRNKNQQLEKDELMKAVQRRGHPAIHFAKYDTDKSGGLSFEEYSAMPFMDRIEEARRRKVFERIDSDKDGQLSPGEIRRARLDHRTRDHGAKPGEPKKHRPHRDSKAR